MKHEHDGEQNRDRGHQAENKNRVPAFIFELCPPPHALRIGSRHHDPHRRQKNRGAAIEGDQESRRGSCPAREKEIDEDCRGSGTEQPRMALHMRTVQ
jgi:hypothetical protein